MGKINILDLEQRSTEELKDCEIKVGSAAKQKQEDLEHLNRLLEGLQLDKDILTQLKVNLQAKVSRKLAGKKR